MFVESLFPPFAIRWSAEILGIVLPSVHCTCHTLPLYGDLGLYIGCQVIKLRTPWLCTAGLGIQQKRWQV